MGRVWIDVFNAAGDRIVGPVSAQSAVVQQVLDGAGSLSFVAPLADARARALLTNEARVAVYTEYNLSPRLVGSGFLTRVTRQISASGYAFACEGPDMLAALQRKKTTLDLLLSGTFSSAISTLAGAGGWSATVSGAWSNVSMLVDTQSVLNALIAVCESKGAHLRHGSLSTTLEVGAFGDSIGVLATNQVLPSAEVESSDQVVLIQNAQIMADSEDICNYVIPIAQGATAGTRLTLQSSTNPAVLSEVDGFGKTVYFIRDNDSIDAYGRIEQIRPFRDIAPASSSAPDVTAAANALCQAAQAWLRVHAQPQESYKLTVTKVNTTIRPGDRIRVFFDGVITTEFGTEQLLQIDNFFYVMRIRETLGDAPSAELEVSLIDRYSSTTASHIAAAMESAAWSEKEILRV